MNITISTTDFTVDGTGNPDRITTIHWRASETLGKESAGRYGTLSVDLPASSTEAEIIAAVEQAYPDMASELTSQIESLGNPSGGSGKPWEDQWAVWKSGVSYGVDDKVNYQGIIYRAVQAHTSEPGWTPSKTPALWTTADNPEVVQPWVQPTGAQDAYATGARVTHDNPNDGGNIWVYESAIDANTVEPGRDGEFDRYWTPIGLPVSPA